MMQASLAGRPINTPSPESASADSLSAAALFIALIMSACFVALTHDARYVGTGEEVSVERGAGLKEHEEFEKDVNAAPAYRKLAFLTMIGMGCYCLLTRKENVSLHFGPTAMLLVCCLLLVLASFFWSVDRGETMREIIRIVAYFFIAVSITMRLRPREVCFVLAAMGVGSVCSAIAVEVLTGNFRPWQGDFRLKGSIHSNVLACHAMFTLLICFAFSRTARRPRLLQAVALAMLGVILLTKTRGALATSCLGVGTIYFASKSPRAGFLVVSLMLTAMSLVALIYVAAGTQAQSRVQDTLLMGRSEGATTLTGRLPLWKELWLQSKGHRWMGFGYGAFWTTDQMEKLQGKLEWFPGHSHSIYMQTMLDLGVLGISLYLMLVLSCLVRARYLIRTTNDPAFYFVFGFLTAGFVDGIVEVSYVYPRGLGLLVAIAMMSMVMVHAPVGSLESRVRQKSKPQRLSSAGRSQLSLG